MNNSLWSTNDLKKNENDADFLLKKLFPICRSITGKGVVETLSILKELVDFDVKQIPSGTKCYDWEIPNEWNIKNAYVEDSSGKKIIDFKKNNLHVVSYSIPINQKMSFEQLSEHLFCSPKFPDAIPYTTSYYKKDWGFCLEYNQYLKLNKNENYHVIIDSTLEPGNLTYGESILKGNSGMEFIISTYCCHPSLGNDNLSGLVLWALLLRKLKSQKTHHTYRFISVPETIGSIAYLSKNEKNMKKVIGGFVISCVAGPGKIGYKKTFQDNSIIDKVTIEALNEIGTEFIEYPFDINGADEIQYSSPYFRIPVGTICKDKYFEYDYYHTSKDNLDFINSKNLVQTLRAYILTIEKLESKTASDFENISSIEKKKNFGKEEAYLTLNPFCEPMLSKRDAFPSKGGMVQRKKAFKMSEINLKKNNDLPEKKFHHGNHSEALRWILFMSDGNNSLKEISEKTNMSFEIIHEAAKKLIDVKLLERIN